MAGIYSSRDRGEHGGKMCPSLRGITSQDVKQDLVSCDWIFFCSDWIFPCSDRIPNMFAVVLR